jgi:hypothetical protein
MSWLDGLSGSDKSTDDEPWWKSWEPKPEVQSNAWYDKIFGKYEDEPADWDEIPLKGD